MHSFPARFLLLLPNSQGVAVNVLTAPAVLPTPETLTSPIHGLWGLWESCHSPCSLWECMPGCLGLFGPLQKDLDS